MEANTRQWLQAAVLMAFALASQLMIPVTGWIVATVCTNAALTLLALRFDLKKTITASVIIPWLTAALDLMRPVLTYPMIFANLSYIFLWRLLKDRTLLALVLSSLAKAGVLCVMVTVVIASWLELHLTKIGSIHYGVVKRMLQTFSFQLQAPFAVLGGALAVGFLWGRKYLNDREKQI